MSLHIAGPTTSSLTTPRSNLTLEEASSLRRNQALEKTMKLIQKSKEHALNNFKESASQFVQLEEALSAAERRQRELVAQYEITIHEKNRQLIIFWHKDNYFLNRAIHSLKPYEEKVNLIKNLILSTVTEAHRKEGKRFCDDFELTPTHCKYLIESVQQKLVVDVCTIIQKIEKELLSFKPIKKKLSRPEIAYSLPDGDEDLKAINEKEGQMLVSLQEENQVLNCKKRRLKICKSQWSNITELFSTWNDTNRWAMRMVVDRPDCKRRTPNGETDGIALAYTHIKTIEKILEL